jgi:hypothetical protein
MLAWDGPSPEARRSSSSAAVLDGREASGSAPDIRCRNFVTTETTFSHHSMPSAMIGIKSCPVGAIMLQRLSRTALAGLLRKSHSAIPMSHDCKKIAIRDLCQRDFPSFLPRNPFSIF